MDRQGKCLYSNLRRVHSLFHIGQPLGHFMHVRPAARLRAYDVLAPSFRTKCHYSDSPLPLANYWQ